MQLGLAGQVEFEILDDLIVLLDQEEIDLHTLPGIGFSKGFGDPVPVRLVGDLGRGRF